jgi:glycosyltransferase involved in cell wall biosynthesis
MIFFVIHWRLSVYSNYFVTILSKLIKDYEITLVDCYDDESDINQNIFLIDDSLYTHLIKINSKSGFSQLKSEILRSKAVWNLVISNSTRNDLSPGTDIAHLLNCHHFLFEHQGCYTLQDYLPEKSVLEKFPSIDQVIVPSEVMKASMIKFFNAEKVHIHSLVPSGIFFKALPVNKIKQKRIFLYPGKLTELKSITDLVKANAQFFSDHDITLMIFGSGEKKCDLVKLMKDFPFLVLHDPEAPEVLVDLFDSASAVVAPSKMESYSMIVVEALLRGIPVLCHPTGIALTLKDKIPGIIYLGENQVIDSEVVKFVFDFKDQRSASQLTRMFLSSSGETLFTLIKADHAKL